MDRLAEELRERIITTVSRNGGHLAANLGAVELTLALLRVFDPATDRIVWDVGHQTLCLEAAHRAARPLRHAAPAGRHFRFSATRRKPL